MGLSQHTVTGADIALSTGLNRTKNRLSNPYNPAYDSDVALTLSQPLLKGAGIAANRAALDQARLGVERTSYLYRGTMMDVVRDTEIAYYQLHFSAASSPSAPLPRGAQRLLYENTAKRDKGVYTDLEVLSADVGVAPSSAASSSPSSSYATARLPSAPSSASSSSTPRSARPPSKPRTTPSQK
jgi:hypothetical protein